MAQHIDPNIITKYPDFVTYKPEKIMAMTIFSEGYKGNKKDFAKDALAIGSVIKNRLGRPARFGADIYTVVGAPDQFSGVGSPEWDKVYYNKLTPEEEWFYKKALQISHSVLTGKQEDVTGGADLYYNPKRANPYWSVIYGETYNDGIHRFLSEKKLIRSKKTGLTWFETKDKAIKNGKKYFYFNGRRFKTANYK